MLCGDEYLKLNCFHDCYEDNNPTLALIDRNSLSHSKMSAAQIKALARVTMAQFAILADEAISADPSLRGEKLTAALMAKLDEPAPTTIDEKPTKIIDEATSATTTVAASFGAASSYTLVDSTSTSFRKFKFQLPYLPDHVSYGGCQMLKLAGGLWVPCGTTCPKDSHDDKCKSCSKSEDDHLPRVSDRVTWSSEHPNEPFQVTMSDGKVKKETTYATFCAKKGIDIRDVQNEWSRVFPTAKPLEFAKYHLELNASSVKQLEAVRRSREKKKNGDASSDDGSHETPKRGRPPKAKTADDVDVKPKRKPGRPKKDSSEAAKIEVEQSALEAAFDEVEDDATAESSHSSAAAESIVSEEPVSTLVEKIEKGIREQEENSDADKAKKASEKAENEAKKAAEKAAKEAKKAAEKAEKEAKKAAEKAEKEAKKAMAKAEKEAKKAEKEAKKAEKEAKKAEKEAKKAEKEAKKEAPLPPASSATPLPPAPPALNEEMNAMKDEIYSCIPFIKSGTGKSAAVKAMLTDAKTIDDLKLVRDMVSDEISTMKKSKKDSVEPSTPPSTPPSMAVISEKEEGEISEHSDSEDEQGSVRVLTKSNGEEITALDMNGVLYNQTTFEMIGSYDETTNTADFIDES